MTDPSQCWYDWQTLLSGIFAVFAAAVSVYFLRKQISLTSKLHQSELGRLHNAARSVLPIALAEISNFCEEISQQIATAIEDRADDFDAAFDATVTGRHEQKRFDKVEIPSEVISTMKFFVESLSNSSNVRHVAELLSSVQMLHARFSRFDLKFNAELTGLYALLLDTAKVMLLNDSIYNYARFLDESSFSAIGENSIEKSWQLIHAKAQGLVFKRNSPDLFFSKLEEQVRFNIDNNTSPWNERFE